MLGQEVLAEERKNLLELALTLLEFGQAGQVNVRHVHLLEDRGSFGLPVLLARNDLRGSAGLSL